MTFTRLDIVSKARAACCSSSNFCFGGCFMVEFSVGNWPSGDCNQCKVRFLAAAKEGNPWWLSCYTRD